MHIERSTVDLLYSLHIIYTLNSESGYNDNSLMNQPHLESPSEHFTSIEVIKILFA